MDWLKRQHLKQALAVAALPVLARCAPTGFSAKDDVLAAQADAIIASIQRTSFPARQFVLPSTADSAVTTVTTSKLSVLNQAVIDCTADIQNLIDQCHNAGGGQVVIPAGRYAVGALTLKSNVNLHLEKNAVLAFIPDPSRYLPLVKTRWEGMELMGYQPLIYAYGADNIAITGEGIIDGGGSNQHWWPWKGEWKHTPWPVDPSNTQKRSRDQLQQWVEAATPVSERVISDNRLRPPLIQTYQCSRVLISGVTLQNSPFWLMNPVLCRDVVIDGVNCMSHGPNSDGCDPESCDRVLIRGCQFDTGDDCIALKSGRNNDGRRLATPIQNVVIEDCVMRAGHGGVVIGSEISGGARNIFARRLVMNSPDLERGLRIKTNSVRGGLIENIALWDIDIGQVKDAVVINFYYEEGDAAQFLPQVRGITLRDFRVNDATRAFELRGFARAPIVGLKLERVQIRCQSLGVIEHVAQFDGKQVQINGKPWQPNSIV